MGAGSLLALMARHSLLPTRQLSKLAGAADRIALDTDYDQRPSQKVSHAQSAEEQRQPDQVRALQMFHVNLAGRLQQLQLQGTGNAHLNWLLDALASTLSTHSSLQSAFPAAASASSAKHRADEVLSLLDACTALKQVADDIDRQLGCLQHALRSVGQALNSSHKSLSSSRLRAAARRLSACLLQERPRPHSGNTLVCITGKHYRPLAEARTSLLVAAKRELQPSAATPLADPTAVLLSQALDGAMLTSLLVLAAAISSLAPPSHGKCSGSITGACKMIIKHLGVKSCGSASPAWAAPLRQLHHDLRQEDMSGAGGSLYRELQGLQSAASKLHATIAAPELYAHSMEQLASVVKQTVESLCKSLQEVQLCTSMLRMQLASFFQALIALRLALLDR